MSLQSVTVTGADDRTNPDDLLKLSREFPFVEWGILYSVTRLGTPRYPSVEQMVRFGQLKGCSLSLHLCGYVSRELARGGVHWFYPATRTLNVKRVQLNGVSKLTAAFFEVANGNGSREFIIQTNSEEQLVRIRNIARGLVRWNAGALWDPSGGRGIEAFSYPTIPNGLHMGFAGGITPSNVLEVLKNIGPRGESFWIDCESGVRTDDVFDLCKARALLEACKPYVADAALERMGAL